MTIRSPEPYTEERPGFAGKPRAVLRQGPGVAQFRRLGVTPQRSSNP
jgi:hypothetical protein